MATTKPRHAITETELVAAALAAAARRWPGDSDRPSRLLAHLIEEGHAAIAPAVARETERRRQAIVAAGGGLGGVYEPGYLGDLRDEWPE